MRSGETCGRHSMSPAGGGQPSGPLLEAIEFTWGNFRDFQLRFVESATSVSTVDSDVIFRRCRILACGVTAFRLWLYLVGSGCQQSSVHREHCQSRPPSRAVHAITRDRRGMCALVELKRDPQSSVNVPVHAVQWEHAYYLKHQNRRVDFVNGWWDVVDWAKVWQMSQQMMLLGSGWFD